ncbi:DUF4393 domain-containing protein [Microvirga sp. STS02]|uniref:Abi-alpha family protein n=1 Tax=Hymenobacter negativus TaxID=2795026 RepID=UPI0018DBA130|nr:MULTISPECIES: Abi-alpha family protein [Bacteria]MBH8569343.1 DUF4393 domain-containing protein [Hymenobacter negativus]MBR7209077.1 DUF4393 domain-containing protein [Microvirga sp. STS02]
MPTDPLSTLAVATGGAFLGKFVGPAAEHYGKLALERAQLLGAKATAYLAAVGREPQAVEPKVLLPLVQAASLETDETLAEKWAALLANAADPAQRVQVQPPFVEVLRQLTPVQAKMLSQLYARERGVAVSEHAAPNPFILGSMAQDLGLTKQEFALCVDNLLRLRLCAALDGPYQMGPFKYPASPTSYLNPTVFGREFVRACTPPAA